MQIDPDWVSKRGAKPLSIKYPSPLIKGRGIEGEGLVSNLERSK